MAFGKCSIGTFNGEVYFFTGRIWELLGYDGFGNLIYDVMESLGVPQGDYGRIEGIVRVCRRVVSVRELHLSVDRVVFRNCVYNVRENRVEDFSPECVQFSQLDTTMTPTPRVTFGTSFCVRYCRWRDTGTSCRST